MPLAKYRLFSGRSELHGPADETQKQDDTSREADELAHRTSESGYHELETVEGRP
jgi:hypothetical protein